MVRPEVRWLQGTIDVVGLDEGAVLPPGFAWDARTGSHRAPAFAYPALVWQLIRGGVAFDDRAKAYEELPAGARELPRLRDYQEAALDAWAAGRGGGVVVLPTGAGKTLVAIAAISQRRRATLVVAPTLDLVRQWATQLGRAFGGEIGVVGGGHHDVRPITVTTYESAHLHMGNFGHRFGMLVFDECHHLPSDAYATAARMSLAPFRLGLTATPERADGRDAELSRLIGPVVYRRDIVELSGEFLADYEAVRVTVRLTDEERALYERERGIYRAFVSSQGIRMSSPSGWTDFVIQSSRSEEGRRAMRAYVAQRRVAFSPPSKIEHVGRLLARHAGERAIVFTEDNATAYAVSRRFLVPVITHHTKVRERAEILERFSAGTYDVIATSKVLNEGVDVPDASVAVVSSGSGSVREHVQRLGRILRKKGDKRATLYELVSEDTGETYTSERRRQHSAYR
ncbi:MAG: DEAD/DEAH box helicase family protein [Polyangiaceae bacterium]|nr:DEAD/DEAH box helicase family protein [Polyangiaceae bacterium]